MTEGFLVPEALYYTVLTRNNISGLLACGNNIYLFDNYQDKTYCIDIAASPAKATELEQWYFYHSSYYSRANVRLWHNKLFTITTDKNNPLTMFDLETGTDVVLATGFRHSEYHKGGLFSSGWTTRDIDQDFLTYIGGYIYLQGTFNKSWYRVSTAEPYESIEIPYSSLVTGINKGDGLGALVNMFHNRDRFVWD